MKPTEHRAGCLGAMDIGGSKIACGLVTGNGEVLASASLPTRPEEGATRRIDAAVNLLRDQADQLGLRIEAAGIGCTGPVHPASGTIGDVPFLPGWEGFAVTEYIEQALSVPVFLENDADAAALGEARFGAGRDSSPFILVTVGSGIGAGIITGSSIYRGFQGIHPEPGHMVIHTGGRPCSCGGLGCWEAYCGGLSWEAAVRQETGSREPLKAADIFENAARGIEPYVQAVQEFCSNMAAGLVNLVNTFAPQRIALTGGIMQSKHIFLDDVLLEVGRLCHLVPAGSTSIAAGLLGKDAGLVGAASIILHQQDVS